jgi:branched-chain amino acid transport system ATP-binding protein
MMGTTQAWEPRKPVEFIIMAGPGGGADKMDIKVPPALASDPKLLLLDEPAAGLSTGESHEMATFLNELDPNLAILMIEHDMDVAFAVVNNLTVLHYGEIVETGSPEQIRSSQRVREIYLGTN